ncbi:MAG: TonB-dependent receptor [Bacteroidales bacterium]|nr:TonB-dependent receptor [Bacteroidales bacterium]
MSKYMFFISCLFCALLPCIGAELPGKPTDAIICGHITDAETKIDLAYVNVVIKGTTIGTTSDASGHFFLKNVPEGHWIIEFKSMGYRTQTENASVTNNSRVEMNVALPPDLIQLDEIVVSSNREETNKRLAPSLVNILDTKLFEETNSTCLAQGLSFQSGLRVEDNCHTCGSEQVRINGLDGSYSQILIDSRPIVSSLAGVYGLEQIPQNMIERVEVAKGGGSALYGSSAIAGTINVITKVPTRNSADISHDITTIGGTNALDNNTGMNISLVTEDHKAGLLLFGQSRYRDGYDRDGDGFTELPEMNNKTIGLHSFMKTSNYSKLSVEYHNTTDYRRGGDHLNLPPHEADVAEEAEHSINGGGVNFDLFTPDEKQKVSLYSSVQNTRRKSYSGAGQDTRGYGNTNDLTYVAGAQYSYNWDKLLFMPAQFTGGTEYMYDKLHDKILGYNRDIFQTVHTESAFIQNEWKDEIWGLLFGGRLDKHNLIDHAIFSPRMTLRYNPEKDVNFRLSYSTGFRAPQIYDEDLHITAVGGEIAIIHSAQDLKPETSQSLSASIDLYHTFGSYPANMCIEGFYTNLDDVFVLSDIGTDNGGTILKERANGSGAKVMGITMDGEISFTSLLQIQVGATFQKSRYDEMENWSSSEDLNTKKMLRTPDFYGYFTTIVTPVKRVAISLSGTYTGSMLVPHAAGYIPKDINVTTPDFFDLNARLSYTFPLFEEISLQLNAGVKNIFDAYQSDEDKGKDRDSDFAYGPTLPRSFFIGGKIVF